MEAKQISWCYDKFILLFLLSFLPAGHTDPSGWTDDMEDAFADEDQSGETCNRKSNDKLVFCRYEKEEKELLSLINSCLCTHIILKVDPHTLSIDIPDSLRSTNTDLKIIISISVDLLNFPNASLPLNSSLKDSPADGVDIRIEQVAHLEDATKTRFLKYIQDIKSRLRGKDKLQTLSITIEGNEFSFINDPQLQETWSYVDFLSLAPSFTTDSSKKQLDEHFVLLQALKAGFPKNKLLLPISLRQSLEYLMNEPLPEEMYPKVCNFINNGENKSLAFHQENEESKNLMEYLRNEARHAVHKDIAGIDVWSLNEDDGHNVCGRKRFPLISEMSNIMKGGQNSFGSFADLDIALSTGESQIIDEIQVLHEQNTDVEEMKKFKCEKIGFFRHPSDCTKFYHCSEYRATTAQPETEHTIFVYKCPRGLVYDEYQGSCNWPSYSEPCQGSDELMPVPTKKFKCTTPGFHADPGDCRWFYYCSDLGDGQLAAFEFLCPSHLLGFDEENLLCNWKWMVPICGSAQTEKELGTPLTATEESNNANADALRWDGFSKELKSSKSEPESTPLFELKVINPSKGAGSILSDPKPLNQTPTNFLRRQQLHTVRINTTPYPFNSGNILEDKNTTFVNYTDTNPQIRGISEYKPENKPNSNTNVQGNTEKKYGTAYWHRSMINNPSQRNNPGNTHLGNTRGSIVSNKDESISGGRNKSNNTPTDHKYGIGRVIKLNLRPSEIRRNDDDTQILSFHTELPNNLVKSTTFSQENVPFSNSKESTADSTSNQDRYNSDKTRGRSLGENVVTNYQFEEENSKNQNPFDTKPYARVKCNKANEKHARNLAETADDNTFGCTGEVSLFVRMKEGNEFSRYVLKTEGISNSAHQESKQFNYRTNDTLVKNNFKSRSLPLENSRESVLGQPKKNKAENNLANKSTQRRSMPTEYNAEVRYQAGTPVSSRNIDPKHQTNQGEERLSLISSELETQNSDRDAFAKPGFDNSVHGKNPLYPFPHSTQKEKETKANIPKSNFMPLTFYPQGVLLNVDLNHINEIPPQILLEVDIMLKKFMADGDIDLNLLMTKLNATMEHMPSAESNSNEKNDTIDSMLDVLENLLNSTDITKSQRNVTDSIESNTMVPSDISKMLPTNDFHFSSTTEDLPYENITNFLTTSNYNNAYNKNISISMTNTNLKNSTDPITRKSEKNTQPEEGVILQDPGGKPFVRRRLFRKYKYPSIREQLEIQKVLSSDNSSTKTDSSFRTTSIPKTVSNRKRYPSIREQLLWNSNRDTFEESENLQFSERQREQSGVNERNDQDELAFSNDDEQFGKRIRTTGSDTMFKPNTRRFDLVESGEPHYIKPALSLPKTQILPIYKTDIRLQAHNVRVDNFVPTFVTEEVRGIHFPTDNGGFPFQDPSQHTPHFQYTLPLPPLYYPTENSPVLKHDIPVSESNSFRDYENGLVSNNNSGRQRGNIRNRTQRRRKSRKLRILVKKLPNTERKANVPVSSKDRQDHTRMKIPKKLLTELRTNLIRKLAVDGRKDVELQIQFQDHVWNIPFVNNQSSVDISPVACTRAGLFQHPKDCNMFYECFWDKWLKRFTLHVFSCPVRLVYDDSIRGCSRPSFESHCRNST